MPKVQAVTWLIRGLKPLMQNRPGIVGEIVAGGLTPRPTGAKNESPVAVAEAKLYRNEQGHFYFPSQGIWKGMVESCPGWKIGKVAASSMLPPAVEPVSEEFLLCDPETLTAKRPRPLTVNDMVVDQRAGIGTDGRGREVMITLVRPKWRRWGGVLIMDVDRDIILPSADNVITEILNRAGQRGIGSGRLRKPKGSSIWVGIRMGKFTAELAQ